MIYLADISRDGSAYLVRVHCEKRRHPEFTESKCETFRWRNAAWVEAEDSYGSYLLFRPNYFDVVSPSKVHELIASRLSVEIADAAVPEAS